MWTEQNAESLSAGITQNKNYDTHESPTYSCKVPGVHHSKGQYRPPTYILDYCIKLQKNKEITMMRDIYISNQTLHINFTEIKSCF